MRILFYSDPHLGLQRKAHFTAASSAAREAHVHSLLQALLTNGAHRPVCLGDFFDKTNNSEEVILRAAGLACYNDVILGGNHDVPNRVGVKSSLDVIEGLLPETVIVGDGVARQFGSTMLYLAPHALTQELYDAKIAALVEKAGSFGGYRILCLHCNYNSPFELSDSTLNLTEARAQELLQTFHFILMGHEHGGADYFEGRLKIIGSPYPCSFGELSGKHRVLHYNTETGVFEEQVIETPYWKGRASELETPVWRGNALELASTGAQYVDLIDDLDPGKTQRLALKLFEDGAFGVRITPSDRSVEKSQETPRKSVSLPEFIHNDLTQHKPKLVPLWEELSA